MNGKIQFLRNARACAALFTLVFSLSTPAQLSTLTVLHAFPARAGNLEGVGPQGMVALGETLYGTAVLGGSEADQGTIFAMNRDGSGFRTLHVFTYNEGDGGRPLVGPMISKGVLYGTIKSAGPSFLGAVYAVNTDGSNFHLVHAFENDEGMDPECVLTVDGDTLFGTTVRGAHGVGTVFSVKTSGADFRTLHAFPQLEIAFDDPNTRTNSDGGSPTTGVTFYAGVLYGATAAGGIIGQGTIFRMNADGTGFKVLRNIPKIPPTSPFPWQNSGGLLVSGNLIVSSGTLYGSTVLGGATGGGVIFSLNTNGENYRVLHTFPVSNLQAGHPGPLLLSGDKLYGAATGNNAAPYSGRGAMFRINLDGTGYEPLFRFSDANDEKVNEEGTAPRAEIVRIDNDLYFGAGSGAYGGPYGSGAIDRLSIPVDAPRLGIENTTANGIRILVYGDLAATYVLEDASELPSNEWQHQRSVTISEVPQVIELPAPETPVFWRARVLRR